MTIQKPGILRKLSVPRLRPYNVLKHYANSDITHEKSQMLQTKLTYIEFILSKKVTNKLNNIQTEMVMV